MRPSCLTRSLAPALSATTVLIIGCSGSTKPNIPPVPVVITLSPASATVDQGATQAFTTSITGATDTSVSWKVQEAGGGSVSATGVYTAPGVPGVYHVVATSLADASKQAVATVTVPQVAVAMDQATVQVTANHTCQLSATISGTVTKGVAWTVVETGGGSVSSTGLYTAPATPGTYHVKATSVADATKSVTATITVVQGVAVQITTAPSGTLDQGASFSLGCAVTGSANTAVTWSVVEADGGSITTGGVYTAPAKAGTFHVKATSVADGTVSDVRAITVASVAMVLGPSSIPVLDMGETLLLSATVSGTVNRTVTWTADGGTITSAGLFTPPMAAGTYHVTATPVAAPAQAMTVAITVRPVAVAVTPSNVTLATGKTKQFAADVSGTSNPAVVWSVQEQGGGTISASGLYTAPATPGTYHVVATSVVDATRTATATVNVVAGVGVAVSPLSTTLEWNATQQFAASVSNATATGVTWTVEEPGGGVVDASGLYTAPAVSGTYHVVATSQEDPTKSDRATITVVQPVAVALTPSMATVEVGKTQAFAASVTGATQTSVTWSVQEGASGGTVTTDGVYTAPATPGTYHVVATSVADPSKFAKATVQVTAPSIVVTLNNRSVSLVTKGCVSFSASVTGISNTGVIYSVVETGGGTITSGGLYTAPATPGTYHVRARSQADASRFDEATITVSQVGVVITPSVITLTKPSSTPAVVAPQAFTASVTGSSNQGVIWTASSGSINAGLYTSSAYQGAGDYTITATSVADPSVKATAKVTVVLAAPVSVSVTPGPATVAANGTQQFTANVANGTPNTVTWQVEEANGGTIDASGLYTAPATPGTYHVRATSVADPKQSALVTVAVTSSGKSITVAAPPASGTSYIYSNGYPELFVSGYPNSYMLTATATGLTNTAVTWSLQEGAVAGTVSTSGTYTCGTTPGTYHVVATSVEDPTVTGVLTVLVSRIRPSVTPSPAQVFTGSTLSLTATAVGYFGASCNWSIQGTGDVGTLSATANASSTTYTPGKTPGTYNIVATHTKDANAQVIVPVTVVDSGISIAIKPNTFTVEAGSKQAISAALSGTTNTACTWKVVETGGGTVGSSTSPAVIYGAPSTVGTYHVKVSSAADTSKFDTATVTVVAPTVRVGMAPATLSVPVGGTARVAAYVTGVTGSTPNLKVNWTLTEGSNGGSVVDDGTGMACTYTAPQTPGTYTLVATSQAKDTATGSVTITVVDASIASLRVQPRETTVAAGGTVRLKADVSGLANTAVNWTVPDGGIIVNGVFTAPATPGTYRVVATSAAQEGRSSTATIKVVAADSPIPFIRPQQVTVLAANAYPFMGGVAGGSDPSVTWATPDGGMVTYRGLFSAPGAAGSVRVTASSLADSTLAATAFVDVVQQAYRSEWTLGPRLNLPTTPATGMIYGSAVRLANGLVLLTGSNNNTVQLLDPAANGGEGQVVGTLAFNTKRQYLQGVMLADGKVLFAGGYDMGAYKPVNTAEVFDAAANGGAGGFTALAGTMTIPRYYHTTTLLPNGKVLITGGMDASYNYLKTAEIFDPATGTFKATTGTMAVTRATHTATLLPNGKVLITGGGNGNASSDAEIFDPATETFSAVAGAMSSPRNWHTATTLQDGRVLVAFGNASTADIYDPQTNAFTQVGATVLLPIMKHSATLLSNGKVLLVGGEASYCQLDSVYVFDPESGAIIEGPSLKHAREAAALLTLDDGSVLVLGGQGLSGYVSSTERFR